MNKISLCNCFAISFHFVLFFLKIVNSSTLFENHSARDDYVLNELSITFYMKPKCVSMPVKGNIHLLSELVARSVVWRDERVSRDAFSRTIRKHCHEIRILQFRGSHNAMHRNRSYPPLSPSLSLSRSYAQKNSFPPRRHFNDVGNASFVERFIELEKCSSKHKR